MLPRPVLRNCPSDPPNIRISVRSRGTCRNPATWTSAGAAVAAASPPVAAVVAAGAGASVPGQAVAVTLAVARPLGRKKSLRLNDTCFIPTFLQFLYKVG